MASLGMGVATTGGVEFRVLGTVDVVVDGVAHPVHSRRQSALLALLLLRAPRSVTTSLTASRGLAGTRYWMLELVREYAAERLADSLEGAAVARAHAAHFVALAERAERPERPEGGPALAELSGVPIKTIRFYSDAGILPPSGRTEARHRRYTEADLARLQLVRSLRELEVDLDTIRALLHRGADLGQLLEAHATTLETRIRALRRQLVVVRAAAASPSADTVRRFQALVRLQAAERRRLLERFWDRATADVPLDSAVAERFRAAGTPELPDDPTPDQLDAWLELAELAADEDFAAATRANAAWFWELAGDRLDADDFDARNGRITALARTAVRDGLPPDGPEAAAAVAALVQAYAEPLGREDGPAFRAWLLEQFAAHHDPRAGRYWELVGRIRGPEHRDRSAADGFEWLVAALKASVPRASSAE